MINTKIYKLLLAAPLLLTSCNKQVFDVTYKYDKVHIYRLNKCFALDSWNDYDGEQLQVVIKNDDGTKTTLLISNLDAMLINGECPYGETHSNTSNE